MDSVNKEEKVYLDDGNGQTITALLFNCGIITGPIKLRRAVVDISDEDDDLGSGLVHTIRGY